MGLLAIEAKLRNLSSRIRGALLKLYLVLHGCEVGKNLKCKQFPIFRSYPSANIFLDDNVNIGYGITIDIHHAGSLQVGRNVNFTQNILLNSRSKVIIGDDVLIAENVSIRDGEHSFCDHKTIASQPLTATPVIIGKDVWIGAFTMILSGATIPNGAVIGAHSIVLSKSKIRPYSVNVGLPVRHVSMRPTGLLEK